VFVVKIVHVPGVKPDDHHVNDERTLGTHPEAEGPAKEVKAEITGEVAHHEGDHKPDTQQDGGDIERFAPISAVIVSDLHHLSPLLKR
jgi:hypothetical protein